MSAFITITSVIPRLSTASAHHQCQSPQTAQIHSTSFTPRHACPPSSPPHQQQTSKRRATVTNALTLDRLANKAYQLEEDEDENSCTTAVYFHEDRTITFGRTDGPEPDRVHATWNFNPNNGELIIDIERFFEGERGIEFMVKRILRGHLDDTRKNLGDLPVFQGAMYAHPADFSKHSEVGFFAMILAIDDLPSEDFDISAATDN